MKLRWLVSISILVFIFTTTGSAFAQDSGERELEEVLVTAQKREQNLQEVPSSVIALSDEKLDVMTSGGADIRLLSSRVPSLHIESSYGRTLPRFYIRGLGNTDFDLNASQPVSLVYDEVVLENPILKGFPIFDLDRVEVLRGPQGTLFGRNTPAGIVKFESRKPSHKKNGFGRLSYGRFDTIQFEGAMGGPLVEDVLAARGAVLYQGRSNWMNNTYSDRSDALDEFNELEGYDDFAGRMQFLLTPNDGFSALVNVHLRDLEGTARVFQANIVESGSNEIRDDFDREEASLDGANFQHLENLGGSAKLECVLDRVTLTSITGYETAKIHSRGDVDGGFGAVFAPPSGPGEIPFPSETADVIPNLDQFTEEFRVSSNDWDRVNFQGGLFFFKEDLEIWTLSFNSLDGGVQDGFSSQTQETTAWAIFGTVDVDVTDKLNASAGVRYSDDEKDFTAERETSPVGGGSLDPVTVNPTADFVSWDVNGLYAVNDDVNVYGRVAQGFRAPSIQGRVLFGDGVSVADTEEILSFEAGVKTDLAQNRARANVSVFHYMMKDQQLTAVGGAGNFNTLLNADKSKGTGFELDFEVLPADQLLVTAGVSYNKTEIDDPNLGTVPGDAPGITVLDPEMDGNPGVVSIDGNSLPNAPEWVFNITARGSVPVGSGGEAFIYTDWAYRSQVHFFLYDSVEFTDDSLLEGGVRVGYTSYDNDYEVAVFGRNITDDLSRTGGIDFDNLTGFVNDPATWGVEIRRNF